MLVKIYGLMWFLFLVSSGVLFLSGGFTSMSMVIFGFIFFGLTFMGMIAVLPTTVAHPPAVKH